MWRGLLGLIAILHFHSSIQAETVPLRQGCKDSIEAAQLRVRSTPSEALRISGPFSGTEDTPTPFWLGFLVAVKSDGSLQAHFWEYDSRGIGHKGVDDFLVKPGNARAVYGGLIFLEAEREGQKFSLRLLRIHRSQTDKLFLHIGQLDDVKGLLEILKQDPNLQIKSEPSMHVTLAWQSLEVTERRSLEELLSR